MKDDILKLISVTKNSILMKTLKDELTVAEDLDLQKIRLVSDLTSESGNLLFPHGTNISNLAIINGSSNGVNIYGGKTTMINLFIKDCFKNSIYFTNGYDGTLTNIYLYHTMFGNNIDMTGDENDKRPTFNNLTGNSQVGGVGLMFKKDMGANINGLSLLGYDDEEILESNNVITKNNITSSTELEDFKWANMF